MVMDFYYVFWVKSVTLNVPPRYKEHTSAAILGFGESFKRNLGATALSAAALFKKGGRAAGHGVSRVARLVNQ